VIVRTAPPVTLSTDVQRLVGGGAVVRDHSNLVPSETRLFTSAPKHNQTHTYQFLSFRDPFLTRNLFTHNSVLHQQPVKMAPTTRSSARKTAVTDARDIISWTSAVTGEKLYYERFHVFEEEGEVLFVQMRMNKHGELVSWTTEDEDGTTKICTNDHNMVTDGLQKMKTSEC
jgi:hypothetical protein